MSPNNTPNNLRNSLAVFDNLGSIWRTFGAEYSRDNSHIQHFVHQTIAEQSPFRRLIATFAK